MKLIEYVYCENQEEWDFAVKKLRRTDITEYRDCGDSININSPNSSSFKRYLEEKNGLIYKIYSFEEWCDLTNNNLNKKKEKGYGECNARCLKQDIRQFVIKKKNCSSFYE